MALICKLVSSCSNLHNTLIMYVRKTFIPFLSFFYYYFIFLKLWNVNLGQLFYFLFARLQCHAGCLLTFINGNSPGREEGKGREGKEDIIILWGATWQEVRESIKQEEG